MGEIMIILTLALALLGLSLIFLEFFFPSGFLIFLAAALLLASIVSFGFLGWGIGWTIFYGLSLGFLAILVIALALGRIRSRVALKEDQRGFQAADLSPAYLGQKGIVVSDLRPTGYIRIDQEQLHAMAERGYVEKGASVQVIEIRGATLIVKVLK